MPVRYAARFLDNATDTVVAAVTGSAGALSVNTDTVQVADGDGPGGELVDAGFEFDGTGATNGSGALNASISQQPCVSAWVRWRGAGGAPIGAYNSADTVNRFRGIRILDTGEIQGVRNHGGTSFDNTGTFINAEEWRHIALYLSYSATQLYLDGVLIGNTSGGSQNTSGGVNRASFGHFRAPAYILYPFEGDVANAVVWDQFNETTYTIAERAAIEFERARPTCSVVLSGLAGVGQTLTLTPSTNDHTAYFTYKWYRADDINGANEVEISGATSSTYVPQEADLHKCLRGSAIAINTGGAGLASGEAFSARTFVSKVVSVSAGSYKVNGTGTAWDVNIAQGVQAGDLILVLAIYSTSAPNWSLPGFTLLVSDWASSSATFRVFYKVADGSEGATVAASGINSSYFYTAASYALRGVTVADYDYQATDMAYGTTPADSPAATASAGENYVFRCAATRPPDGSNWVNPPANTTRIFNNQGYPSTIHLVLDMAVQGAGAVAAADWGTANQANWMTNTLVLALEAGGEGVDTTAGVAAAAATAAAPTFATAAPQWAATTATASTSCTAPGFAAASPQWQAAAASGAATAHAPAVQTAAPQWTVSPATATAVAVSPAVSAGAPGWTAPHAAASGSAASPQFAGAAYPWTAPTCVATATAANVAAETGGVVWQAPAIAATGGATAPAGATAPPQWTASVATASATASAPSAAGGAPTWQAGFASALAAALAPSFATSGSIRPAGVATAAAETADPEYATGAPRWTPGAAAAAAEAANPAALTGALFAVPACFAAAAAIMPEASGAGALTWGARAVRVRGDTLTVTVRADRTQST